MLPFFICMKNLYVHKSPEAVSPEAVSPEAASPEAVIRSLVQRAGTLLTKVLLKGRDLHLEQMNFALTTVFLDYTLVQP